MKTKQAAVGKWEGILRELGLDDSFLRNRHGPCPLCGGSDRFRFDDRDGEGTYFCNSCGAGDGIKLAMGFLGGDFQTTCKRIDSILGNVEAIAPRKEPDPSFRIRQTLKLLKPLHRESCVRLYLSGRGCPASKELFEGVNVPYYGEDGRLIGRFPAMVGKIVSSTGELLTLHITYLTEDGRKANVPCPKKMLPPMIRREPGAIRLTRIYETLGIAEGIETALAASKLYNLPVWAAATAGNLEQFKPPEGVKNVVIFGDRDASYRGQAAAFTLAHRLHGKFGVKVLLPEFIGDFADKT